MDSSLAFELLAKAATANGVDAANAELIRNGSHAMWSISSELVGRVGEKGTEVVARREVAVSQWLSRSGLRVVRAIDGFLQPTVVNGYPVTWWELLPRHRAASPKELGEVLRRLHAVDAPAELGLTHFSPLDTVRERLPSTRILAPADRSWMLSQLDGLSDRYVDAVRDIPEGLIHGDAWQGNVAVTDSGEPVLLDLEAVCIGPQYWDLLSIAVDHTDFARITTEDYGAFVAAYGFDVTTVPEYRTLAEMQEWRWISYVVGKAEHDPAAAREAAHRISCMRGDIPLPWQWNAY